jgi:hypothetical protein
MRARLQGLDYCTVANHHAKRPDCGCPSSNTKSGKEDITDAFGIPFHTDNNDDTSGVNDLNASYIHFFASYYRTGTRKTTQAKLLIFICCPQEGSTKGLIEAFTGQSGSIKGQ